MNSMQLGGGHVVTGSADAIQAFAQTVRGGVAPADIETLRGAPVDPSPDSAFEIMVGRDARGPLYVKGSEPARAIVAAWNRAN